MQSSSEAVELPTIEMWDVTGADVAFGAPREVYAKVTRQSSGHITRQLRKEQDVFSALFYSGGKMSDHGLKAREGIDERKARACLQAIMCSFDPPHEVKEAVAALAIHQWWEPINAL